MIDLKKEFKQLGQSAVRKVRDSLTNNNRNATGKTSQAIRSTSDNNGFIVYAPNHVQALQDGRKPSNGSGGNTGGFFQQIVEWCRARGIDEGAAYPIYRKINQKGYKGTPNLLNNPLKDITETTKIVLSVALKKDILDKLKISK